MSLIGLICLILLFYHFFFSIMITLYLEDNRNNILGTIRDRSERAKVGERLVMDGVRYRVTWCSDVISHASGENRQACIVVKLY